MLPADLSMATQNVGEVFHRSNPDWQLDKKLWACLLYLYNNKLWTDISFRCMDHVKEDAAERIFAHKIVLAARSPVFEAMFYGPCADGKNEVELLTIESRILDLVIRYMYCDEADIREKTAPVVMEVAHMYRITGLVSYCAAYLQRALKPENACEILELALFYDQVDLREAACAVIDDNAQQVLESDGFLQISHSCLIYILKGNTFFSLEANVFTGVEKWAVNKLSGTETVPDGQMKRRFLSQAFTYLRVPTMNLNDFLSCTKRKGYYTLEETEDILDYINTETKDKLMISCHSAVKRLPRLKKQMILTVPYEKSTYVNELEYCVLAKVSRDSYLERLIIGEMEPWLLTPGMESSNSSPIVVSRNQRSSYDISFKTDDRVDLVLNGVLRLPELDFETVFEFRPKKEDWITIKNPLFLMEREDPYSLNVEFAFESSVYGIRMEGFLERSTYSKCFDDRHQPECLERLKSLTTKFGSAITFTYCRSSKHVNGLRSFKIRHVSNREDKTTETRRQPGTSAE